MKDTYRQTQFTLSDFLQAPGRVENSIAYCTHNFWWKKSMPFYILPNIMDSMIWTAEEEFFRGEKQANQKLGYFGLRVPKEKKRDRQTHHRGVLLRSRMVPLATFVWSVLGSTQHRLLFLHCNQELDCFLNVIILHFLPPFSLSLVLTFTARPKIWWCFLICQKCKFLEENEKNQRRQSLEEFWRFKF